MITHELLGFTYWNPRVRFFQSFSYYTNWSELSFILNSKFFVRTMVGNMSRAFSSYLSLHGIFHKQLIMVTLSKMELLRERTGSFLRLLVPYSFICMFPKFSRLIRLLFIWWTVCSLAFWDLNVPLSFSRVSLLNPIFLLKCLDTFAMFMFLSLNTLNWIPRLLRVYFLGMLRIRRDISVTIPMLGTALFLWILHFIRPSLSFLLANLIFRGRVDMKEKMSWLFILLFLHMFFIWMDIITRGRENK